MECYPSAGAVPVLILSVDFPLLYKLLLTDDADKSGYGGPGRYEKQDAREK